MRVDGQHPLITTIPEKCRTCYICVRECPAKAIRISSGQAEVLVDRCIGCGNCFRVCRQGAKQAYSSIGEVRELLDSGLPVAAMLAPSFPAAFGDLRYRRVVGMFRALGFSAVHEVGFGADLVAQRYRKMLIARPQQRYIATTCPALVEYVERFHSSLVDFLAPVVSPMLAEARVLRRIYGLDMNVVFIGPCIAKKAEQDPDCPGEINGVLTFIEARQMLDDAGITPEMVSEADFDEPRAFQGALFPISRGMLQAANINEDLMAGEVVSADGRYDFVEAVEELESGALDARMLEALCCTGCIMGPGIQNDLPLFHRRSLVSRYVRQRSTGIEENAAQEWLDKFSDLNLSRRFTSKETHLDQPNEAEIRKMLYRMGKFEPTDELDCGACGYETCWNHAKAVLLDLAESEMCLPYTIKAIENFSAERSRLMLRIAHNLRAPLGAVLGMLELLREEHVGALNSGQAEYLRRVTRRARTMLDMINQLLTLSTSRTAINPPEKTSLDTTWLAGRMERTFQNKAAERALDFTTHVAKGIPPINGNSDQIEQLLENLVSNAIKYTPDGGKVTVSFTSVATHFVTISIIDSGIGIPEKDLPQLFSEFFRAENARKKEELGTGLGLAIAKEIVESHQGRITVESQENKGTTVVVTLPAADA